MGNQVGGGGWGGGWGFVNRVIISLPSHKGSLLPGERDIPVPALLTQDQAHIAVGGREHIISLMYFWLARMKSCDGLP